MIEPVETKEKEERIEYPVPRELADQWIKAEAALSLRDEYISCRWHSLRKALKLSMIAEKEKLNFWGTLRELYGKELRNKAVSYDPEREVCWDSGERKTA